MEPIGRGYFDNYEPATGSVYSQIPDSDVPDVKLAVEAAERAFPKWSETPAGGRSEIILKIVDLINERFDELVNAESKDNGKPLKLAAAVDIPRAACRGSFQMPVSFHLL